MRNRRLISVLLALALLLSSASFVSAQQPVPTSSQNLVPLADMPPKPTPPPPGCYPTEITPSLIKSATGVYLPHGGIHLEWDVDATCLPTEINILVRTEGSNNWTEIPKPPSGAWSPQDTTEYSPGWNTNFRIIATWGDRGVNKDLQVGIPFWGFGVTPLDKDGRVMSWYVSDSLSMISENRFIFNLAMRPGPNDDWTTLFQGIPVRGAGRYIFMHGRADLNIWEYRLVFWDNASGAAYVMDTLRQDRFSVEPWVTVSAFGASLHQTPESAYNAVSMGVAVEKPEVTGYTAYLCEENFQPFVAKASSPDAFTDSLICREIGWSYANGPGSYYFFNTNLPRMPSRRVTNMVWADILTSPIRHQRLVGYADVWAPMPIILGQTFLPLIKADSSTPEPPPPPLVK